MAKKKNKKLKELILYIVGKSQDDNSFDALKLCLILYLIDFEAYALWGKSVTGAKYIKSPHGPEPKGMSTIIGELVKEGKLKLKKRRKKNRIAVSQ